MKVSKTGIKQLFGAVYESCDLLPGLPVVELVGERRVLIENHNGVIEYGTERISVKVKFGVICVSGCDLELAKMTRHQLVITGTIHSLMVKRKADL